MAEEVAMLPPPQTVEVRHESGVGAAGVPRKPLPLLWALRRRPARRLPSP